MKIRYITILQGVRESFFVENRGEYEKHYAIDIVKLEIEPDWKVNENFD